MKWEWIPVIGFVKTAIDISRAQHAYNVCYAAGGSCWEEYNATWPLFNRFGTAMVVTMSFLVLCLILVRIIALFAAPRKEGEE